MTSQILRHTAVVLAGMASIGFTVAAGTYVVNQMATGQHEAAGTPSPEDAAADAISPLLRQAAEPDVPRPSTAAVRFTSETRELPVTIDLRHPAAMAPAPAEPSAPITAAVQATTDLDARLPLPGDAYVGANLTRPQPDSLSMTLDTNLLGDTAPGTRLRTDLDVRNGRITLALSDPYLGSQSIQMSPRHADPATPDLSTTAPDLAQPTSPNHRLATA
ncbi:hypothetical protein [Nocardia miyunensis]|uniref:hypothetical protein n=1 Tax=Nocardia miyunensis TaxID=282684 RepID=UPI00082E2A85|nr:hypothetical protein [Nocardia miyunensis]